MLDYSSVYYRDELGASAVGALGGARTTSAVHTFSRRTAAKPLVFKWLISAGHYQPPRPTQPIKARRGVYTVRTAFLVLRAPGLLKSNIPGLPSSIRQAVLCGPAMIGSGNPSGPETTKYLFQPCVGRNVTK
ncbi:hypothetical protein NDU88_001947 [Pleurodeles waltl]|uniref:Uncharacterized protein n=1 Tax=Pleurodeles waltl TaxID=8319 RepID=A0AAV7RAI5_PLEWA|nr:hypothetical protein NDU88_001947 [Pleurodeles waltl]